jgi:hypothetical protein
MRVSRSASLVSLIILVASFWILAAPVSAAHQGKASKGKAPKGKTHKRKAPQKLTAGSR